MIGTNYTWQ